MTKKILIVDDSEFAQLKLRRTLEDAGFEIAATASNVADAIERYARTKPDLVTMDIVMVGMDGVTGVREMIRRFTDAKILIVSAMGQEKLIEQAIANGAKGFVVKPYKDDEIIKEVRRLLMTRGEGAS